MASSLPLSAPASGLFTVIETEPQPEIGTGYHATILSPSGRIVADNYQRNLTPVILAALNAAHKGE